MLAGSVETIAEALRATTGTVHARPASDMDINRDVPGRDRFAGIQPIPAALSNIFTPCEPKPGHTLP